MCDVIFWLFGQVDRLKEAFPGHSVSDKVLAESISQVGSDATAELLATGAQLPKAWQTVEKKELLGGKRKVCSALPMSHDMCIRVLPAEKPRMNSEPHL